MSAALPYGASPLVEPARVSVRGASVIGREHLRVGRNNQDGFHLVEGDGFSVGVVTDGCGSQARSEVGAVLGARFLAAHVAGRLRVERPSFALAERAQDALTAWLYGVARDLEVDPSRLPDVIAQHFLFTWLCVARRGDEAVVFGLGDGAVLVDDAVLRLDAGPDNAPPYAAYRLFGSGQPTVAVHFAGQARRLAIATDGFDALLAREPAALRPLLEDDGVWRNPAALKRRLNVLAERERLADDATLILSRAGEG